MQIGEVVDVLEQGYVSYNSGKIQQPSIVSIEVTKHNFDLDIKSCYNEENNAISVKAIAGSYENGKKND